MKQPLRAKLLSPATSELLSALEGALAAREGKRNPIASVDRSPCSDCSSFKLEIVDLTFEDGKKLQLIFKDLGREGLLETARRIKPDLFYDPLREIECYRMILSERALGTAAFYGAVAEERSGRYWLFIEKVPGWNLSREGNFEAWLEAARWLARLHAGLSADCDSVRKSARLLKYDAGFYGVWLGRARTFLRRPGSGSNEENHHFEWLAERYEQLIARLLALPRKFIHGEFYPSNVLLQNRETGIRICPVDWEMAAVGPGLVDLAALTSGKWSEEEKRALALAYHDALLQENVRGAGPEDFLDELDVCRLHLAVQWLGWSSGWTPPAEHAHDWLSEAIRITERLRARGELS